MTIVTDDCNAGVVRACLKQRSFFTLPVEPKSPLSEGTQQTEVEFFAFPPASGWNRRHDRELRGLAATHDCYVAIERAGKAADGSYYTVSPALKVLGFPSQLCYSHWTTTDASKENGPLSVPVG